MIADTSTTSPARSWPSPSRRAPATGTGPRSTSRPTRVAAGARLVAQGGRVGEPTPGSRGVSSARRRAAWSTRRSTRPDRTRPTGRSDGGRCRRCARRWPVQAWPGPGGVSTTWTLRRSEGQFCRATSPASTMRSTSRVTPPVVSATSALSLLMVRRPSGGAPDVDEDVEPDQRDATVCSSSLPEQVGQAAVGAHQEAHQLQPLVVDLAQDAAGAGHRLGAASRLASYSPCSGNCRRPHTLLLNLAHSTRNRRFT